ncbi:NADPH-dependent ferric siderophore reductase, contains FAD-binding and SIP domains [Nocardioides exalbidus]|uniref:NADPH-dependent ferric siderophore reductase, contains FAD-binding and SIP domains n=1 Tax=Nocardioides exalbidus TaxID=402596 RepID=A0A1H4MH33_9ACTN|nr:siderophore-interacting protein [Nocardioides exalbidus]SEB82391.1 NADPH-dependent ferric siderophore reductase, contains FAD-binding and SIP domains [Nocardioides exalbidus]
MTTTSDVLPLIFTEVEVVSIDRLGPTFVRVELGSPELAEFGVEGPRYDQRMKLVFPDPVTGGITSTEGADASWFSTWMEQSTGERGHMRTYTIRDVRGSGAATTFVVDMVLHLEGDLVGPGSTWASTAEVGDRIVVLAPRRGHFYGGIEFAPPEGAELLLVGDETAVPAVCAVLEQLPAGARGTAFLEVPHVDDVQTTVGPAGVEVVWLARAGAELGARLHDEVVAHLGIPGARVEVAEDEVDPDLWETPTHSSSGEEVAGDAASAAGTYAWIAGESKVVTGLRRHLVNELGFDRSQVAFMGYWRRGVAMRS